MIDIRYVILYYIYMHIYIQDIYPHVGVACYHVLKQTHPVQTEMALFCLSLTEDFSKADSKQKHGDI